MYRRRQFLGSMKVLKGPSIDLVEHYIIPSAHLMNANFLKGLEYGKPQIGDYLIIVYILLTSELH